MSELFIIEVTAENQQAAKTLILSGLAERFGWLDESLNGDLNDIVSNYLDKGDLFFMGIHRDRECVCTGALTHSSAGVGQIERMSVAKRFRRQGYASTILNHLEQKARENGLSEIILETNLEWADAIGFYLKNGYSKTYVSDGLQYFMKQL